MLVFENKQNLIEILDEHITLVGSVVDFCVKDFKVKYKKEVVVSIIIIDDEEMRTINMQYRNIDKPTDVLSFPMSAINPFGDDEPELEIDLDTDSIILGDIAISAERTHHQAKEYGHSFNREIGFLVSHGVYHLLGYDHKNAEDEEQMNEMQENILKALGITR